MRFVAFKLPNLLRRGLRGRFAQAFVPILAEYKKRVQKRRRALSAMCGDAVVCAGLVTALGILPRLG
nr:lipid II flippase MurJ [Neisseria meningitidis]